MVPARCAPKWHVQNCVAPHAIRILMSSLNIDIGKSTTRITFNGFGFYIYFIIQLQNFVGSYHEKGVQILGPKSL